MEATGIVRRIDDLGRIVIPREIRLSMRLKDGDALEIFLGGEGSIILKKYPCEESLKRILKDFKEIVDNMNQYELVETLNEKIENIKAILASHKD